jgi:hypothetical protein
MGTPPRKNSGTLKALKAMHMRAQTRNSGLAVRVVALGCFFMVSSAEIEERGRKDELADLILPWT